MLCQMTHEEHYVRLLIIRWTVPAGFRQGRCGCCPYFLLLLGIEPSPFQRTVPAHPYDPIIPPCTFLILVLNIIIQTTWKGKTVFFRVAAPCKQAEVYRRYWCTFCLNNQGMIQAEATLTRR